MYTKNLLGFCLCWFAFVNNVVICQRIIEGPDDTVARRTQTVILECDVEFRSGSRVTWSWIGDNNINAIYMYEGNGAGIILPRPPPGIDKKYEVRPQDELRGIFDLYIFQTETTDGGTYECGIEFTQGGIDDAAEADVVIIDTPTITQDPSFALEGEYVGISCFVAFGTPLKNFTEEGQELLPRLAVYYQGEQLEFGDYTEIINVPGFLPSQITEDHNRTLDWEDNGQNVRCEVTVDKLPQPITTSRPLEVLFGVRDMSFEPNQDHFFVGDTLTCKVFGNPEPEIVWEPLHDTTLANVSGSQLRLSGTYLGTNRWRCRAENTFLEETYFTTAETEFLVTVQTTTTTTTRAPETTESRGSSSLSLDSLILVLTTVTFGLLGRKL